MTQRKNKLFPRQVSDIGAFIFVCVMMPATYFYETMLVIPTIYRDAFSSQIIHNIVGLFLLANLLGNFCGLWLTDTSTRYVVLPSVIKNSRWKFCASCESVRPPRWVPKDNLSKIKYSEFLTYYFFTVLNFAQQAGYAELKIVRNTPKTV